MSKRELALSLLLLMFGLATWDGVLGTPNFGEGQVRLSSDGTMPPK